MEQTVQIEQPKTSSCIRVIALAAETEEVKAEKEMTVVEVLRMTKAKIKVPKNGKIMVNGIRADLSTLVKGGDKIVVSPRNKNG